MLAVSNTSPISNLAVIGKLDLLQAQFGALWIPGAVADELQRTAHEPARQSIEAAQRLGWLKKSSALDSAVALFSRRRFFVGKRKRLLAIEMKAGLLLIDERDGRLAAHQAGLTLTGILGILLRAKKLGQIEAVKSQIDALRTQARFGERAST